jgi:hypothetical protein
VRRQIEDWQRVETKSEIGKKKARGISTHEERTRSGRRVLAPRSDSRGAALLDNKHFPLEAREYGLVIRPRLVWRQKRGIVNLLATCFSLRSRDSHLAHHSETDWKSTKTPVCGTMSICAWDRGSGVKRGREKPHESLLLFSLCFDSSPLHEGLYLVEHLVDHLGVIWQPAKLAQVELVSGSSTGHVSAEI